MGCVSSVLNVGAKEDPTPDIIRMRYDTLDVKLLDTDSAPLKPAINQAMQFVNQVDWVGCLSRDGASHLCAPHCPQAVKDNGKIAFCCKNGESRSAAVLIGCLILIKKTTYDAAYAEVEDANPYIEFNEGFEEQLKMLATGASEAAVAEVAARREPLEKKKGKNKAETVSRRGARDAKGRSYDD
jgi:hypothetical protein